MLFGGIGSSDGGLAHEARGGRGAGVVSWCVLTGGVCWLVVCDTWPLRARRCSLVTASILSRIRKQRIAFVFPCAACPVPLRHKPRGNVPEGDTREEQGKP